MEGKLQEELRAMSYELWEGKAGREWDNKQIGQYANVQMKMAKQPVGNKQ